MPTVTRELSITYAGVTVGGSSDAYHLDGPHTVQEAYESATLTCTVVCVGATEAAFNANLTALENAFRTPRGALTVTLGRETLKSWSHTGNTGFYANPSISKLPDGASTGRSRRYQISITVNRPADLAGQGGRLTSQSRLVIASDGKRNVIISGRYTATSGTAALANYLAGIAAFQASMLTLLASGVSFELTNEERVVDDANKFCDFTRTLNQIADEDNLGNVTNHQLILTRSRTSPGDAYQGLTVKRLVTITAAFRGGVTVGASARQTWDGTIVPWIMGKIRSVFSVSTTAVVDNVVNVPIRGGEPLTGSLVVIALDGSNVVEFQYRFQQRGDMGRAILTAWDPDPYAAYLFQGPATSERTLSTRTVTASPPKLVPDGPSISDKLMSHEKLPDDAATGASGWVTTLMDAAESPAKRGLDSQIAFIERNTTHVQRYMTFAKGSGFEPTIEGGNRLV